MEIVVPTKSVDNFCSDTDKIFVWWYLVYLNCSTIYFYFVLGTSSLALSILYCTQIFVKDLISFQFQYDYYNWWLYVWKFNFQAATSTISIRILQILANVKASTLFAVVRLTASQIYLSIITLNKFNHFYSDVACLSFLIPSGLHPIVVNEGWHTFNIMHVNLVWVHNVSFGKFISYMIMISSLCKHIASF